MVDAGGPFPLAMKLIVLLLGLLASAGAGFAEDVVALAGTKPLTKTGDLSAQMHEAALRDMDRRIAESLEKRAQYWHRNFSKTGGFWDSIAPNYQQFKRILGMEEPSHVEMEKGGAFERVEFDGYPSLVSENKAYRIWQVRWPALWPSLEGIHGEGLLLEPTGVPKGMVVAIPDADSTPEEIAGLDPLVPEESQFGRHLVEDGFVVVVPALVNREPIMRGKEVGSPIVNETRREWIHRQAYMMGRTMIGLELEKILAADKWLAQRYGREGLKLGVAGYGEGGLLAFYAAAVDDQIQSTLVSGYFRSRQETWKEPLYRNVWGLLREFGDAEIASFVSHRVLVVEYSPEPGLTGPPQPPGGGKNFAAPGQLTTPTFADVEAEFKRIGTLLPPGFQERVLVHGPNGTAVPPGSPEALEAFERALSAQPAKRVSPGAPTDRRPNFSPVPRQARQEQELESYVQNLVRRSGDLRDRTVRDVLVPEYAVEKWNLDLRFGPLSPERVVPSAGDFRKQFWEDILGKIEDPLPPANPRTRKIYDEPKWTGYEVVVDVDKEGFAWGILCVPKDLKPGEKRPVVVCQHGRNGLPQDVITGDKPAYRNFAARLAERGFITFAPHNLYKNEASYRLLSRKGNTIGLSMFSVIVRHHQQWLNWLGSLPFVDPGRIAFYGLSYGGESAMRIPSLLEGYCLSICSGDFNDWPRKVASTDDRHSFMFTDEWEMPYFNMGNTFSYAELTYLMFPRPFMVERGHHDQVAPDSWVASEYAKTRWFYDQFGLGDRTAIEFFNGGHTINGQGTFEFLHKHLHWPEAVPKLP